MLRCLQGWKSSGSRVKHWGHPAGHKSPVSATPNPGTSLPDCCSTRLNLRDAAGAVSSTAAGAYCHLSHSPKGKPTTGSGPTQCDGHGSRRGSSIENNIMFLGAATEKMTGMSSYTLCREWGVNMHSPYSIMLLRACRSTWSCSTSLPWCTSHAGERKTQGFSGSENWDKENETFRSCKQRAPYLPALWYSCSP